VYCPREVFPIASVISSVIDSFFAMAALGVLFAIYAHVPPLTAIWIPLLWAILLAFTTAVTLFVAAVTVYLRDMKHALPLLIQLGLFATPVIYRLDSIPERFRATYVALNPLAAVIDGARRALLEGRPPRLGYTVIGATTALVALAVAFLLFKRLEAGMADVA
jgi:ABC-type polysaccharide/polyol phosphate export permease